MKLGKTILTAIHSIFPHPRAYLNFVLVIMFLGVFLASQKWTTALFSLVAFAYFFNEWVKSLEAKR